MRVWVALFALVAGVARAEPDAGAPGEEAAGQPSVAMLQAAALRLARLEPERVDSWQRRMRYAALAPTVRVRVGRGTGTLSATTDYNGTTRLTFDNRDAWTFEVGASWSLDRLVWHPDEMRVAREAQRMAARREKLLADVAALHAERRRLLAALSLAPPQTPFEVMEARLRLEEVSATLDGLTGGALGRALESARGDPASAAPTEDAPPPALAPRPAPPGFDE